MESRLRKSYLEKSLAISNGKKTGKPFIAEMLLRTCVWISSCSWKAPCSLHTSRSVLYVRSLNTLAKFLTNHCRSNSLRNKLFLFFVLVATFSMNWPGNVCYAIYRSTCQTHYYSWLISTIRKLYLQQISPTGKSRVCLIAENPWPKNCLIKLLTVTHTMLWILKTTMDIIRSKYFPNSDWLKAHA